ARRFKGLLFDVKKTASGPSRFRKSIVLGPTRMTPGSDDAGYSPSWSRTSGGALAGALVAGLLGCGVVVTGLLGSGAVTCAQAYPAPPRQIKPAVIRTRAATVI